MPEKDAVLQYKVVGNWRPAQRRYIETVASEACVEVSDFFKSENLHGYENFTISIAQRGRSGDDAGEAGNAEALIYAYHDEITHRKMVLSGTITHELIHLLRDLHRYPLSVVEAFAHEGIAHLAEARMLRSIGKYGLSRYLDRIIASEEEVVSQFKKCLQLAKYVKRNDPDYLYEQAMQNRAFKDQRTRRPNGSLPIGVAVGVVLASKRQAEGATIREMVALPTNEFIKGIRY